MYAICSCQLYRLLFYFDIFFFLGFTCKGTGIRVDPQLKSKSRLELAESFYRALGKEQADHERERKGEFAQQEKTHLMLPEFSSSFSVSMQFF